LHVLLFYCLKGRLSTNTEFSSDDQEALRYFILHVLLARQNRRVKGKWPFGAGLSCSGGEALGSIRLEGLPARLGARWEGGL
jgi:pantoate kinase